jgi:hypothetical protein
MCRKTIASKHMNYRQKKNMQVTNEHMRIRAVPFTCDEQASSAMSLTGVATAKSREKASSRSNAILITI